MFVVDQLVMVIREPSFGSERPKISAGLVYKVTGRNVTVCFEEQYHVFPLDSPRLKTVHDILAHEKDPPYSLFFSLTKIFDGYQELLQLEEHESKLTDAS
jgi:hypothetical protein